MITPQDINDLVLPKNIVFRNDFLLINPINYSDYNSILRHHLNELFIDIRDNILPYRDIKRSFTWIYDNRYFNIILPNNPLYNYYCQSTEVDKIINEGDLNYLFYLVRCYDLYEYLDNMIINKKLKFSFGFPWDNPEIEERVNSIRGIASII